MKTPNQTAPDAHSQGSMSLPQHAKFAELLDMLEAPAELAPAPLRRPETTLRDLGAVQLIGMCGGMCEPAVLSLSVRDGDDQASALLTEAQALQLAREICRMVGGWRT